MECVVGTESDRHAVCTVLQSSYKMNSKCRQEKTSGKFPNKHVHKWVYCITKTSTVYVKSLFAWSICSLSLNLGIPTIPLFATCGLPSTSISKFTWSYAIWHIFIHRHVRPNPDVAPYLQIGRAHV